MCLRGTFHVAEDDACENNLPNSSTISNYRDETKVLSHGLGNYDDMHIPYNRKSEPLAGNHGSDTSLDEEDDDNQGDRAM